ncbi:hypothetical protein [Bradyrhizobium sp. CCBAU 51627]|uniref:hypothetical protein n=1 Tax=Bradyrhizobium sp. CCBAU 51627 TaxID=1325088 RepID=UPI00230569F8|nr:hypothetical protein [Bradyrhizobium sp. CCBAU 51627]
MRLELKLAAFGIILLLPKTSLYLSNDGLSEAQTAPERLISAPVAHRIDNSTYRPMLSTSGEQDKSSTCAAKPGHSSDIVAVHATNKSPTGS